MRKAKIKRSSRKVRMFPEDLTIVAWRILHDRYNEHRCYGLALIWRVIDHFHPTIPF